MFIQILLAIIATLGFGILFGLDGKNLFFASISGGIGWFSSLIIIHLKMADPIGFLMGSLLMTIYSEIMARKLKAPAITFLIGGLIPLVPGSGVYYTMYNLIIKNISGAVEKGVESLLVAGAIAVGILVGSTICRIYYTYMKTKK
ncbi:MAG: threonine/serine exporter family protein [Fusobacteriaceae bacterium]|jgi:uncharacterized membrane protein YjjB (DUF3815 family)|nr:threonine/serine exporter family protein [Fusobacteriaceae bacterium]